MDLLKPYTPQLLSVLRVISGLLVLQHGTAKHLNFPAGHEQRLAHDDERC
jgi:putative oxidoreductase